MGSALTTTKPTLVKSADRDVGDTADGNVCATKARALKTCSALFVWAQGQSSEALRERALPNKKGLASAFIGFLVGLTEVLLHRWFVFQTKSYVPGIGLQFEHHDAMWWQRVAKNRMETGECHGRGNDVSRMFDRIRLFGCCGQDEYGGFGGE